MRRAGIRTTPLEQWMSDWGTPLLRFAFGIMHNQADAEDVVQETFLRLWKVHRTHKAITRSYAYQVALNVCRTQYKRNRHRASATDGDFIISSDDTNVQSTMRLDIHRAMGKASYSDREVILLHYFADYTLEEMSQILGVSVNTVKTRLFRARKRLAQSLAAYDSKGQPSQGGL
ncbi:MAG: RNA polymerase sigma factor [Sulfobacillus sp.]